MEMLYEGNNMGYQLAFYSGCAMAFVSAFYATFYIKEKCTRAKLLQLVSGVNIYVFWVTAFIWDLLMFVITISAVLITFTVFQEDGFKTSVELMRLFLVYLCFGFAIIPVSYVCSMFFNSPSTGFVRLSMFYIFTGSGLFVTVFMMKSSEFNMKEFGESLTSIFMIFPHFAFSSALCNINIVNTILKTCDQKKPFTSERGECSSVPMCCSKYVVRLS